jgi:hypothetical protein
LIHLHPRNGTAWAKPTLALLLAVVLSASTVLVVAATVAGPPSASAPLALVGPTLAPTSQVDAITSLMPAQIAADTSILGPEVLAPTPASVIPSSSARLQAVPKPKTVVIASKPKTVHKAVVKTVNTVSKTVVTHPKTTISYSGVYHLWIPALSLSRDIDDWGCNGGLIPNHVERWGCAGRNNIYLLGHAWGVFAKIHDGYHSGALHVGLVAFYADKSGTLHRYRISAIRHVLNANYDSWSGWATGASSTPIITLQTCDGPTSAYRILVRLVLD